MKKNLEGNWQTWLHPALFPYTHELKSWTRLIGIIRSLSSGRILWISSNYSKLTENILLSGRDEQNKVLQKDCVNTIVYRFHIEKQSKEESLMAKIQGFLLKIEFRKQQNKNDCSNLMNIYVIWWLDRFSNAVQNKRKVKNEKKQ